LSCYVRLMRREDISHVTQIDREAFSTIWPPANYRQEMDNRLAHYIVACDGDKCVEPPVARPEPEIGIRGLLARVKNLFNHDRFFGEEKLPASGEYIVGFTGIWTLAEEAHITNVAVRKAYQGQGIGELLMIAVIRLAIELHARFVTLEVRESNLVAQNLYKKHGFSQVGIRRGYYTDNQEDGLLMSTPDIRTTVFQSELERLKQAHSQRWEHLMDDIEEAIRER